MRIALKTLLQKADDGDVRRNIWGWWRSHHPHIFRREHLHGSFFSGVIELPWKKLTRMWFR